MEEKYKNKGWVRERERERERESIYNNGKRNEAEDMIRFDSFHRIRLFDCSIVRSDRPAWLDFCRVENRIEQNFSISQFVRSLDSLLA